MKHADKNESHIHQAKYFGALVAALVLTSFLGTGRAEAWDYQFVSSGSGAKTWMIDVHTSKVAAEIPSAGPLQEIVSADGAYRYVVKVERDEVSVVDNATNEVKDCIRVGQGPFGLALSVDGKKLFVFNRKSHTLSVIDSRTNKVVETNPAPKENFGIDMSAKGRMSMVK